MNTVQQTIDELGKEAPWFHSIDLGNGIVTCPPIEHLNELSAAIRANIPQDLSGQRVLDVGCNAGFFSVLAKRAGADYVLGIDMSPAYLKQAEFVKKTLGLDIEYRHFSVYDVLNMNTTFDLVFCLGVIYHLTNPFDAARALWSVTEKVAVIESHIVPDVENRPLWELVFPGYDRQEHGQSDTERNYNWWFPTLEGLTQLFLKAGFLSVAPIYKTHNRAAILCTR